MDARRQRIFTLCFVAVSSEHDHRIWSPTSREGVASPSAGRFLAAMQRRMRGELWVRLVGDLGAVLAGIALLGCLSAGWFGRLSLFGAGAAATVALAVHVRRLRLARRRVSSEHAAARLVSRLMPGVGDELLSLVELDAGPLQSGVSAELVEALRDRVGMRVSSLLPSKLVDLGPARRRLLLRWSSVALATVLAWALLPGALARGWRALWGQVGVSYQTAAEPIIGDVKLVLHPPAYTGLPTREIAGSSGEILALPGTEVDIEARALVSARRAVLILKEGDAPAREETGALIHSDGTTMVRAKLTVKRPGSWRFALGKTLGAAMEPEAHRIDLEIDRPPTVELFAPEQLAELTERQRIELGYSVDDDYGLGAVDLVWRVAGENADKDETKDGAKDAGKESRQTLRPGNATPARSTSGTHIWDLGELGLKKGAKVAYWLEARDNDTVSGPKVTRSRTYYLGVANPNAAREQLVAEEQKLLELALTALANRLELTVGEPAATLDQLGMLKEQVAGLMGAIDLVVKQTPIPESSAGQKPSATQKAIAPAMKELAAIRTRLGKLVDDEGRVQTELGKRRASLRDVRPAIDVHLRQIDELEKDTLLLDDLLGRQRLEELLALTDEMNAARDRLKQLLAEYKKTRSAETKKAIERELKEIEQRLRELAQKASKLASEMPDQFLNRQAMGKNDTQDALSKMREMLEKGDIDQAMAELERLSSSLDQLSASMEGDLNGYRGERFSADEQKLAELESKLADIEHDQKKLRDEAAELKKRAQAETERQLNEKVKPVLEKARQQAAELKKRLAEIDPPSVPSYSQEDLTRLRQRADDLDRNLGAGDIEEARDIARSVELGANSLSDDLKSSEMRRPRPGTERARGNLGEGAKLAKALGAELDRVMPRPGQQLSSEEQRQLGEMAERQRALRGQAEELMRQMEQKGSGEGDRPPPGQSAMNGLKGADEHMQRAEQEMRSRDARDAESEAKQALDKLGEARRDVQRERRPRDEKQGGGMRADKEPVRIPNAEEWKAPREFRQDLLEAMKKAAPGDYQDAVRRYYEELVK